MEEFQHWQQRHHHRRPADRVVYAGVIGIGCTMRMFGGTNRALVRADAPVAGKVGIVTGGGSGHLPVFLGYVGRGLPSGVAVGNVFSSPSVGQIAAATRGVDSGKGVLYLYGNYSRASLRGYCSTPVAGQPGFLAAGTQQGAA